MSQIAPVITKETTMWRCWVGFNASHSMGLILFGLLFGFLALAHRQLLFQSPFLLVVGLAMLGGLVVLCKIYFFSVPLIGISISLACYVASIALSRALIMRLRVSSDNAHAPDRLVSDSGRMTDYPEIGSWVSAAARISPYSYPSRKKLNGGFSTARVLLWAVKIRGSPGG